MRGMTIRWLILTAAVLVASYLIEGIRVDGFFSAFLAAAILGILNAFFRPVLLVLTLPINILTLGLFTFIINALLLKMVSGVISGFEVSGFWSAVFGALVISIVNWFLSAFVNTRGSVEHIRAEKSGDDVIDLKQTREDRWE